MPGPTLQYGSLGVLLTAPPASGLSAPPFGSNPVGPPVAAGLGASPATYTNNTNNLQVLNINAAASATTTITKQGVIVQTAVTPAATGAPLSVVVAPGQSVIVTFSAPLTSQFVDTP